MSDATMLTAMAAWGVGLPLVALFLPGWSLVAIGGLVAWVIFLQVQKYRKGGGR